jgi:hypothetical protein
VRTATKWQPVELSLVAVAADPRAVIRGGELELARSGLPADRSVVGGLPDRAAVHRQIRTMAAAVGLPQAWIDNQIDAGATLVEANQAAFMAMQARSAALSGIRVASVGWSPDDPDWRRRTIGEGVYCRMTGATPSEAARPFADLTGIELAKDCLRARNLSTTGSPAAIIERAMSTSDLPSLMGDAIDRTMRISYQAAPAGLKRVSKQVVARDFRKRHRIQISAAPTLLQTNQLGEFTHGVVADTEETYSLTTYGRIITLSRQVLVNDDLGALTDLTRRMGVAAANFEAVQMATLLESNPNMADGEAVFSTAHANIAGSGATISNTTLSAARLALRHQTEPSGMIIDATPRWIVVPSELETLAEQQLTAIRAIQTADVNIWASLLSVVTEPRLTDAYKWFLFADPGNVDGMEYCYLEGEVGPRLFSEVGFDVDGLKYKIRLDFACAWVEYRGAYMNPGH